jgi:hypothetical protein
MKIKTAALTVCLISMSLGARATGPALDSLKGMAGPELAASIKPQPAPQGISLSNSDDGIMISARIVAKNRKTKELLLAIESDGNYLFVVTKPDGNKINIGLKEALAEARTFTKDEISKFPDAIRELRDFMVDDPEIIKRPWDPKKLHKQFAFPLVTSLASDTNPKDGIPNILAYAFFGGPILDITFTAVTETGAAIYNAGAETVTLAKNEFSRAKNGIQVIPFNKAAKKSAGLADATSTRILSDNQFACLTFTINNFEFLAPWLEPKNP